MDTPLEVGFDVRVSPDGAIKLPPALLALLGLGDGDEFVVRMEGDRVVLERLPAHHRDTESAPDKPPAPEA